MVLGVFRRNVCCFRSHSLTVRYIFPFRISAESSLSSLTSPSVNWGTAASTDFIPGNILGGVAPRDFIGSLLIPPRLMLGVIMSTKSVTDAGSFPSWLRRILELAIRARAKTVIRPRRASTIIAKTRITTTALVLP